MFRSPGDRHQILKVINWPLMAINPILNVMYQLLKSIHGHTYRAVRAAQTNSIDTVGSWLKFKAICEVVPLAYQKVRRHELQITLSLTNLRLNLKKETSWGSLFI